MIADGGPGLTQQQQERLFLPFAAGDAGKGSGLGLAICQALVQSLGGEIELRNRWEEGRLSGLDAQVWLPLSGTR